LSPLFPRLIHAYRTQRPKVNISLLELSSSLQIEAIEQRELDVGLLRLPDNAPRTELVFTPLMEEPLLVAMHAGHRLAKATSIKIKDLRGDPFIAYPRAAGVAVSQQILALCAKRGFEPQVVQEAAGFDVDRPDGDRAWHRVGAGYVANHRGARRRVQNAR
jgi:DNA-binding transcriptional LysR family regulator